MVVLRKIVRVLHLVFIESRSRRHTEFGRMLLILHFVVHYI